MKADSTAGTLSDAQAQPIDNQTLTDCSSMAEWLNAVKPYTCGDLDKCIVVGKNTNSLGVLSNLCYPNVPPQYPACPDHDTQCLMIRSQELEMPHPPEPPADCPQTP